jgi:hypothetical protein
MTLKNNTGVDRQVALVRYANVDADGKLFNSLSSTRNSAFVWNIGAQGGPFGLVLQNVGTSPFEYTAFVQISAVGPAPCDPFRNQNQGILIGEDAAAVMFYFITVPKGASKTVTVSYKGL